MHKEKTSARGKRLLYAFIVIMVTTLTYWSCKKTIEPAGALEVTGVSTNAILKSWVEGHKENATPIQKNGIDSLLAVTSWELGVKMRASNGKSLVFVPLHNSNIGLEFFYDEKNSRVDSGNIIRVDDANARLPLSPVLAVQAYYESVVLKQALPRAFSGTLAAYSILNKFQYGYAFSGGTIVSHTIAAPKPMEKTVTSNEVKVRKNEVTCELWGLWTIWADGTATLTYTWWVCSGAPDCTPPSLAISIGRGQQYIRVNCEGNNNGGGGGNPSGGVPVVDAELAAFEADYRSRMSTEEQQIFDNELTAAQRKTYLLNAYTATKRAESYYPTSVYNGKGDALRHALFVALNASDLGADMAKRLSDAHELNPGHALEKEMDKRNNAIGISIFNYFDSQGLAHSSFYLSALVVKLYTEIADGNLWIISPTAAGGGVIDGVSQLVPSNQ